MDNPARLVVMISGGGSNLQALIDAAEAGRLPARIVAVVSNRAGAYGLQRAERHGIPAIVLPHSSPRAEYDAGLAQLVAGFEPDWVVLAGWMRLLTMHFLRHFPNRVVNLHPALPGRFPGTHAIERAFAAARRGEIDHTGVMVHLVPDEGIDDGPVLASQVVPIRPDDTLEALERRVHAVEHQLLVDTLRKLIVAKQKRSLSHLHP
jgi:formyltetrahydrofolate-dependent phosphoribosylglycinamide formyltransferase